MIVELATRGGVGVLYSYFHTGRTDNQGLCCIFRRSPFGFQLGVADRAFAGITSSWQAVYYKVYGVRPIWHAIILGTLLASVISGLAICAVASGQVYCFPVRQSLKGF